MWLNKGGINEYQAGTFQRSRELKNDGHLSPGGMK